MGRSLAVERTPVVSVRPEAFIGIYCGYSRSRSREKYAVDPGPRDIRGGWRNASEFSVVLLACVCERTAVRCVASRCVTVILE